MIASISNNDALMETAVSLANTVISTPARIPVYVSMARIALGLAAVHRQDREAALEQYSALEGVPGIMLLYVNTDRVLGLLAQTLGNFDLAAAHFEESLAFCRRAGYRPELAWSCHDYAATLLQNGYSGRHDRVMLLLNESLEISRELGMNPLMERVMECLDHANSMSNLVSSYPDGLTQREVEVLLLIAAGLSNQEIADKLVLSVRTVERHITSIYTKSDSRNRAEATSYAFRHAIVDQLPGPV